MHGSPRARIFPHVGEPSDSGVVGSIGQVANGHLESMPGQGDGEEMILRVCFSGALKAHGLRRTVEVQGGEVSSCIASATALQRRWTNHADGSPTLRVLV